VGRFIFLIFLCSLFIYGEPLSVKNNTQVIDLLPYGEVFIDNTQKNNIKEIQKLTTQFKEIDDTRLSYGYSPKFDVWLKFTLHNDSNQSISKIIEYNNPLTTKVEFYDILNNLKYTDGLFFIDKKRTTINPIFEITLKPYEEKTYYLKSSSHITTLIIKLNLWDEKEFFKEELYHQIVLALFFGAMLILAIYNFSIFLITKDISYFYYVLYILGIIAHHLVYVGFASIFILEQNTIIKVIEYASILVSFPIIALAFFTKTFLNIKQYTYSNNGLKILLVLVIVSIVICSVTNEFNKYRNLMPIILFVYLLIITIYAAYKKNTQAYFILFGWTIIVIASILMFLSGIGIYDFNEHFKYIVEISFVLEAIIFSVALASRINKLQYEKNEANNALIIQQKMQQEILTKEVKNKTIALEKLIGEKDLLLKEINHRVKNNMQTIVSLLRLQSDTINEAHIKDIFQTIHNRINAISHLHELLYKQEDITHIDANEYLSVLISEIRATYSADIDIKFNVNGSLKIEEGIYCGLILNEIVTNAFKYAFPNGIGIIDISLTQNDSDYLLSVKDNGIGFNKNSKTSIGTLLIETLVIEQLEGVLEVDSSNGVYTKIRWKR